MPSLRSDIIAEIHRNTNRRESPEATETVWEIDVQALISAHRSRREKLRLEVTLDKTMYKKLHYRCRLYFKQTTEEEDNIMESCKIILGLEPFTFKWQQRLALGTSTHDQPEHMFLQRGTVSICRCQDIIWRCHDSLWRCHDIIQHAITSFAGAKTLHGGVITSFRGTVTSFGGAMTSSKGAMTIWIALTSFWDAKFRSWHQWPKMKLGNSNNLAACPPLGLHHRAKPSTFGGAMTSYVMP